MAARIPLYPYQSFNDEHKVIFVHIPKNAGSSVLSALGAPERGRLHIDYSHYLRSDSERFARYLKFAVVRDPVSRAISAYRYLIAGGNQSAEDLELGTLIRKECSTFDGFIQDFLTPSVLANWDMFRPQSSYICARNGALMVDIVLHFESLDEDYQQLRRHIASIAKRLPCVNRSAKGTEVSAEQVTLHKIREFYMADYDHFYS